MSATLPETAIFDAVDATWPGARTVAAGDWRVREGLGGGQRVSAASTIREDADINVMETTQDALGQLHLAMVRGDQGALDRALATRGYRLHDPVDVWLAPVERVAAGYTRSLRAIFTTAPLAIMNEVWDAGGIGPARRAVMTRAAGPKTCILGRLGDRARGALFAAVHGPVSMVHAVEVQADARRQGVAERMVEAAAWWAADQGATHIGALTLQTNTAAQGVWRKLGLDVTTAYHYRVRDAKT
ncbi:MAG: GNAT family N-acetyltransferase [Pseudomonadota bacterium]